MAETSSKEEGCCSCMNPRDTTMCGGNPCCCEHWPDFRELMETNTYSFFGTFKPNGKDSGCRTITKLLIWFLRLSVIGAIVFWYLLTQMRERDDQTGNLVRDYYKHWGQETALPGYVLLVLILFHVLDTVRRRFGASMQLVMLAVAVCGVIIDSVGGAKQDDTLLAVGTYMLGGGVISYGLYTIFDLMNIAIQGRCGRDIGTVGAATGNQSVTEMAVAPTPTPSVSISVPSASSSSTNSKSATRNPAGRFL